MRDYPDKAVKLDLCLYLQLQQFPYLTSKEHWIKITSTELVLPPKIQLEIKQKTSFVCRNTYVQIHTK